MGSVKLANVVLWTFNALVGAAVVYFAFQYLIFRPDSKLGHADIDLQAATQPLRPGIKPQETDKVIKDFRNPIEKKQNEGPLKSDLFKAMLKGTLASEKDPKVGMAFLRSNTKNIEFVASVGEDILPAMPDGTVINDYAGWKLIEVSKDSALFSNGSQKQLLTLDQASAGTAIPAAGVGVAGGAKTARAGQPYEPSQFKSRVMVSAENRLVWGLDPDEVDWATQNVQSIVEQDFQVAPFAGGGLKVENVRAGSIGATRGVISGDIIKDVNGVPLNSLADIQSLSNNPALRQPAGLRVTVERAGRPMTIEYRPLPK